MNISDDVVDEFIGDSLEEFKFTDDTELETSIEGVNYTVYVSVSDNTPVKEVITIDKIEISMIIDGEHFATMQITGIENVVTYRNFNQPVEITVPENVE